MEFLLEDQSDDESACNEEIKKRLLQDLGDQPKNDDELSQFDEKSVLDDSIFHNVDHIENDLNQSQTWNEFMKGNQQRDVLLKDIEQRLQQVKIITQGILQETEIEVDDDYEFGKKVKMKVNPLALRDDQITSIKRHVLEAVIINVPTLQDTKENYLDTHTMINSSTQLQNNDQSIPDVKEHKSTRFHSREEKLNKRNIAQDLKMNKVKEQMNKDQEQLKMHQEQLKMEQEDERSLQAQKFLLQTLLSQKADKLNKQIQFFEKQKRQTAQINLGIDQIPSINFQPDRFKIQDSMEENLALPNAPEIVKYNLKQLCSTKCLVLPSISTDKSIKTILVRKDQLKPQTLVVEGPTETRQIDLVFLKFDDRENTTHQHQRMFLIHSRDFCAHRESQLVSNLLNSRLSKQVQQVRYKYVAYKVPFTLFENMLPTDVFQGLDESPTKDINETASQRHSISSYSQHVVLNVRTKKLDIKLEGINSLDGIELFKAVSQVKLSSNNLIDLGIQIKYCQQIIEINLAQNQICKYDVLGTLKNLRVLILEMNLIEKMQPLKESVFLELYNMNGNHISVIENLENLIYLKRLILFKNQIISIGGLTLQFYLEELDLGSNQINRYDTNNPFSNCFNLRKLYLYNNNLTHLPQELCLIFLTSLWIQQNGLTSLNGLHYLPSLQELNASDNQLTSCLDAKLQTPFMPQLQKFNVSRNKLTSFGSINKILRFCELLQDADYRDNPFLNSQSQNVLQLQQFIMMRTSLKLSNVNKQSVNRDDYDFLASKFDTIIDEEVRSTTTNEEKYLKKFASKLLLHNESMNKLKNLSERKLLGIHEFVYTTKYKSLYVLQDVNFVRGEIQKIKFENIVIKEILDFERYHKLQLTKVKSFLIQWIYTIRRRNRYYKKNIKRIIKSQALIRGWNVRKIIPLREILSRNRFEAKAKYALKIQKAFKAYIFRRRRNQAFLNIKYVDKEIDDMEDFDDSFFNQPINLDYGLKVPDGVDISKLMMAGLQAAQQKQKIQPVQQNNFFSAEEQKQQAPPKLNKSPESTIQMRASKFSTKSEQISSKQKEQNIMNEWGFTNPEVAKAFAFRMEKDKLRKDKNKVKNMSAQQRLQRFQKNADK